MSDVACAKCQSGPQDCKCETFAPEVLPDRIRFNWSVAIECVDCGEVSYLPAEAINLSKQLLPSPTGERYRWAIVTFPNECPKCHNLRAV